MAEDHDSPKWDLSGMDLTAADFVDRDLTGVNLRDTKLGGARLVNANLTDAIGLTMAQLSNADLACAKLPPNLDLKSEIETINDRIRQCRNIFVALVSACTLCLMGLLETTSGQLLADNGTASLPLIGTAGSTRSLFVTAPVLLGAMFIYFQLHLHDTWNRLGAAPLRLPNGLRMSQAVFPWLPISMSLYHRESRALALGSPTMRSRIEWMRPITDALLYVLVPLTVLVIWGRGVALHDTFMSVAHALVLVLIVSLSHQQWHYRRETLYSGPGLAESTGKPIRIQWWVVINLASTAVLIVLSCLPRLRDDVVGGFIYNPYMIAPNADLSSQQGVAHGVIIWRRDLRRAHLDGANLDHASLVGCQISNASFKRVDMNDVRISQGTARRVLIGTKELESHIISSSFVDAELNRATIRYTRIENSDFTRSSLDFAHFVVSGLSNVSLRHSTARCIEIGSKSKLTGVTFAGSDLRGASFAGATLDGVSFRKADLRGAIFDGAILYDTVFEGARLEGASFRDVLYIRTVQPSWLELVGDSFDCEELWRSQARHGEFADFPQVR